MDTPQGQICRNPSYLIVTQNTNQSGTNEPQAVFIVVWSSLNDESRTGTTLTHPERLWTYTYYLRKGNVGFWTITTAWHTLYSCSIAHKHVATPYMFWVYMYWCKLIRLTAGMCVWNCSWYRDRGCFHRTQHKVYNLLWMRRVDSKLNVLAYLGYLKRTSMYVKSSVYKDEFKIHTS